MKAFVHQKDSLALIDLKRPIIKEGQVLVRIKSAGLNRRDLMIKERRGYQEDPVVLGSDGAGIVEAFGHGIKRFKEGDAVIVNPGIGWIANAETSPETLKIVGYPDHGTFAEYYLVEEAYLEPMPSNLNWQEAGVLALAGLTGYRALFTKGCIKPKQTVFIPGAGSGVATYLIQFAKAVGARIIVTSRSESKCQKALQLGADRAISTDSDWEKELQNEQIDLIVDSVGQATFARSLSILKKGGRFVTFGATTEDEVTFDVRSFFYAQQQILGTTLGSREELREMLAFIEEHNIKPVVDKSYPIHEIEKALTYLSNGQQFGKISITFP